MSENNTTVSCWPPMSFMVFLVFLALKLAGIVDWSWWIVTMPLWLGLAVFLLAIFGGLLVAGVVWIGAVLIVLVIDLWDAMKKPFRKKIKIVRRY